MMSLPKAVILQFVLGQMCVVMFQDLDKKLDTLVLHSSDVSEETEESKRYGCLEIVVELHGCCYIF